MTVPTQSDQKRKDAVRALINVCLLEAMVLALVAALYLATYNLTFLIGGLVGSILIFGPAILRWAGEHGAAMKSVPDAAGKDKQ